VSDRDYSEEEPREDPAGGESTHPSKGTPPIEQEGEPGQTQVPAADDDVGVPSDGELEREEFGEP